MLNFFENQKIRPLIASMDLYVAESEITIPFIYGLLKNFRWLNIEFIQV